MIGSCKKQISVRWITFTIPPWAAVTFNYSVIGAAFIFSLKKFVENPAGVTFILSLPVFFAIIVAPLASFLSDLAGLGTIIIGGVLLRWARRPIELPNIPSAEAPPPAQ